MRTPFRRCVHVALVIAAMAIGTARCGGNPGSPSSSGTVGSTSGSATCRTYPTAANVVVTQSGTTMTARLTALFNTSNNSNTITTISASGATCTTSVDTYRSKDDFVDEVRVIPGLTLQMTRATTNSPSCGGVNSTVSYEYRFTTPADELFHDGPGRDQQHNLHGLGRLGASDRRQLSGNDDSKRVQRRRAYADTDPDSDQWRVRVHDDGDLRRQRESGDVRRHFRKRDVHDDVYEHRNRASLQVDNGARYPAISAAICARRSEILNQTAHASRLLTGAQVH